MTATGLEAGIAVGQFEVKVSFKLVQECSSGTGPVGVHKA